MSRFTLAIDPGAHTGLALYCEEQYVASATTDGSSFLSLRDAIGKLIEPHGFMANKVAAVEAGYLGFNPKTGLLLERRRGFCVAAAETHGFSTLDIYPSTWQSKALRHLGERGAGPGHPKRVELKRRALALAKEITGGPVISSDAADAICLGWVVSRGLHLPGAQ